MLVTGQARSVDLVHVNEPREPTLALLPVSVQVFQARRRGDV